MEIKALGNPPIHYQWQKDGTDITEATDSVLTIAQVQPGDAGEYRCIASNSYGIDTSNTSMLWVEFSALTEIQGITDVSDYQVATYSVETQQGHIYDFIVDGGNRIDRTENSITIHWGKSGQGHIKLIETSEIGCVADTNTLDVIIGSSGIADQESQNLSVYPNPAKDFIVFDITKNMESSIVEIYDIQGKRVIQQRLTENKQIAISNLAQGLYLVRLIDSGTIYTGKFIVE